ncbi:hypothetical protein [Streptomyces sp. HUAS TT20]|uniref:hypothetical protein n=1 Tax=Streptomyces sp. HUAS TT20 TaxID=3447509 RepID=UPI0021DB1A67|nr:hypothetical protein [Streptomyces sp. HUAS 15-9]UXY31090.1 hypothetical protein N8I87_34085 [Streptomyces sp. HUAS 15-9]
MSASPAVRSLRAAVFAAVCVLLAAAGHGLAMGAMPPLWGDAAGFLGVFTLGWLLGGRERSLPGIGAAMLVTQAGLHIGFDAARPTAPAHAVRTAAAHAHGMAVMHAHGMAAMARPHAVTAHTTAAHVLAALVASWWLRRGEAALWSLLRRAVALVPGLVAWWRDSPLPAPLDGLRRAPDVVTPVRRVSLRYAVRRRGPPGRIPYTI